ncbi:MAG: response regulator [Polyangiaceae bacterium]|nr:response regulator [Polyangiaceae bacterium]
MNSMTGGSGPSLQAIPSRPEPEDIPADNKVDILLVDDNPSNLLALEAMLEELGQNLVKATSGPEALKCLLDQDFALILMDIQMPGMDGIETAELIRQRERSRHIPILFATAYTRTEAQVFKGYSVGAVDFLFKPIVPEILRSKVNVFVELYKKTEEVKRQAALLREAEQREHDRKLEEARRIWESQLLREEMEHERRIAEAQSQRAEELTRAEEALKKSNARLSLLAETANRLLLGSKPQDVLGGIYSRLSTHLDLEVYMSYLVFEDGKTLRLDTFGGLRDDAAAESRFLPFGTSICGVVAEERKPIIAEHVQKSDDSQQEILRALGIAAFACYPLLADDRLLGALAFGTRKRSTFHPDELHVMQVVSNQVAMAMERSRLIHELHRRADELAEADRRKDEFLAMLAHELRNPLAPILNAVHMLRMSEPRIDPIHRRAVLAMDRQVRHMIRLVDDLLDVSRITNGKIQLRKESVSLDVIVEQAVQTSRPLIEDRHHELSIALPSRTVRLLADPTRLTQIIANLLNNAAKYTDPGGSIKLRADVEGDGLILRVCDNGIGLSPEMLPKIFELFVQSERGADRAQGGLGIGLTLVRSLVEMHGGTIVAHSDGVGRGSEFVVRMPLDPALQDDTEAPSRTTPLPASEMPPAEPSRSLHVLVVEDNDDIRETLKDLLELCGHEVDVAADGASGVERTLALRPDVALIDIGLPGLDGYQVARKLRAELKPEEKRPKLIALTGYGQPGDKQRALDAGFDAHLVKPVDYDDLAHLLSEPG